LYIPWIEVDVKNIEEVAPHVCTKFCETKDGIKTFFGEFSDPFSILVEEVII